MTIDATTSKVMPGTGPFMIAEFYRRTATQLFQLYRVAQAQCINVVARVTAGIPPFQQLGPTLRGNVIATVEVG